MKTILRKFYRLNFIFISLLIGASCQKVSDDNHSGSSDVGPSHYLSDTVLSDEFRELSRSILTDDFVSGILETRHRSPRNDQKVLVVGGGVAGLVASLEAFKNNSESVTMIEKRKSYSRSIVMRLDEKNLNYIESLTGSGNFERLIHSGWLLKPGPGHPPAKRIIVLKKLEYLLAYLAESVSKKDPSLKIHYGYKFDGQVSDDGDFKLIPSSSGSGSALICPTDYLIGADSAHSEVTKYLNLRSRNTSNISYAGIINYSNLDVNGSQIVDPKSWQDDQYVPLWNDLNRRIDFLLNLISGGWDPLDISGQNYGDLPRVRMFVTGDLIYMAREFTKREFDLIESQTDPELKRSRAETMLKLSAGFYFGHQGQALTPLKDKIDIAVFPVQLTRVTPGVAQVLNSANNKKVSGIVIGDARATTHFFTGTGVNIAIEHAVVAGAYRTDDGLDFLNLLDAFMNRDVSLMHLKSAGSEGSPPDARGDSGFLSLDRTSLLGINADSYTFRELLN